MTTTTCCRIEINVYRADGEWYGARWIDGEYDGCDRLDVEGGAPESAALEAARIMPLLAHGDRIVRRVSDAAEE